MTLDTERLRSLSRRDLPFTWRAEQSVLYALSIGFGREADSASESLFLLPGAMQRAIPSMATVMSVNVFEQDYGWQYAQMVHGGQTLHLHRPLLPTADMVADFSIEAIHDKGPNKPAIIVARTDVRDANGNVPLFTMTATLIARADGGFDGPQDRLAEPYPMPDRSPDLNHESSVRPEQALLYRMNGDRNPLHLDTATARQAGFEKPILHGLCTYGFACRAVLETICDYDNTLIGRFDARFTAPVYPGDTLRTQMWQSGDEVTFRCVVPSRNAVVLDNGYCRLLV